MSRLALPLALLLATSCAAQERRRSWDDVELGPRAARQAPRRATPALPPLDPAELAPTLPPRERPPRPREAWQPPAGGRLVATFDGPVDPLPAPALTLPEPLWLPALPDALRAAVEDGRLSPELAVDGAAEADVDGDGVDELVVLARPVALFEAEGPARFALLLVLQRAPGGGAHRLASWTRLAPERHAAAGGPARWCHAAYRLAGFLRRGERALPLVWQERGVGCAQLVGGGFDRALHLVLPGAGEVPVRSVVVAGARLLPAGAVDLYDGAAWIADVEGDGSEELVVRGVPSATRPCGGAPASWTEELAARVLAPDGFRAWAGGRAMELEGGALPPSLLHRHPAACGAGAAAGPAHRGR